MTALDRIRLIVQRRRAKRKRASLSLSSQANNIENPLVIVQKCQNPASKAGFGVAKSKFERTLCNRQQENAQMRTAIVICLLSLLIGETAAATKQEVAELERVVRLLTRTPHGATNAVLNTGSGDGDIRIAFTPGPRGSMQLSLNYLVQFWNPQDGSKNSPPLIINITVIDADCDGVADVLRGAYDERFAWLEPIHLGMLKRHDVYGSNLRFATDHIKGLLALHAPQPRKKQPQNKGRRK